MEKKSPPISIFRGKIVGGAIYVHKSALHLLSIEHTQAINKATNLNWENYAWNVLKLNKQDKNKLSFLDYQDFDEYEFPCLNNSYQIDLKNCMFSGRKHSSSNPPVLHRKELLINRNHPSFRKFSNLTKTLEELGAFKNIVKLGTKLRWKDELDRLNIVVTDHVATRAGKKNNVS